MDELYENIDKSSFVVIFRGLVIVDYSLIFEFCENN